MRDQYCLRLTAVGWGEESGGARAELAELRAIHA